MLDKGDYRGRAIKGALGTSKNGNEQVGVEFELLDHPGQSITWYGTFTEAAFEIAMRGLRAAGKHDDDLSDFSWISSAPEVVLVVDHETYNGKERAKVKFINSQGGLAMTNAMDATAAKSFADRMRAKVLLFNQGQPPPKQPKRQGGNEERSPFSGSNEDVPF